MPLYKYNLRIVSIFIIIIATTEFAMCVKRLPLHIDDHLIYKICRIKFCASGQQSVMCTFREIHVPILMLLYDFYSATWIFVLDE